MNPVPALWPRVELNSAGVVRLLEEPAALEQAPDTAERPGGDRFHFPGTDRNVQTGCDGDDPAA